MAEQVNRRAFLEYAARTVAAGAVMGGLPLSADERSAGTQPAAEWRNKQPTMGYARLGRSGFMVSRCVFGAGGLYGKGGDTRLLEIAIERGMNCIDTGRPYPQSEATISPVALRHRDRVWIISKAGHIGWPDIRVKPGEDAEAAKLYTDQLDESLRELKVDTIDCYMIQGVEHEWVVTMDALYEAFVKARKAGKVRYFGLATHTNVPKVCELAAKSGRYDVVLLAVNPNSVAELSPAIRMMREAGIGVISMKTSGPIGKDAKAFDGSYGQVFAGQELSPYQRAYAYLLARGGIDAFNAHMSNQRILDENLAVPTLKLSEAELNRLQRRTLAEALGSCHHCGSCGRACPEGIDVPGALRCHAYVHHYHEPDWARSMHAMLRAGACRQCGACHSACPESIDLPTVVAGLRAGLA